MTMRGGGEYALVSSGRTSTFGPPFFPPRLCEEWPSSLSVFAPQLPIFVLLYLFFPPLLTSSSCLELLTLRCERLNQNDTHKLFLLFCA